MIEAEPSETCMVWVDAARHNQRMAAKKKTRKKARTTKKKSTKKKAAAKPKKPAPFDFIVAALKRNPA